MSGRLIALPLAAMLALAGCATEAAPRYDLGTAQGLQAQVYAVSELAAQSRHPEALTKLDELATAAQAALASGSIDQARYDRIMIATEQVRGRLGIVIAAAEKAALEQQLQDQQRRLEEQQAAIEEQDGRQSSNGDGTDGNAGTDEAAVVEEITEELTEEIRKAEQKAEEARQKADEAREKAEQKADGNEGKNDD